MTRLLAIDWDRQEARAVLALGAGKKLKVLAVGAAPLVDVSDSGTETRRDVGQSLRVALDDPRTRRSVTLVGIERAAVDLMNFTLPPAIDRELPELVLNQAMRESQLAGEEAAVDFVSLSADAEAPRQVLAAVLGPDGKQRVADACAQAGLHPERIVLRPLAAASLFAESVADQACLLINVFAEEADFTVLADGKVVFLRTVRLPSGLDEDAAAGRVVTEVQRTLLVVQQGALAGRSVDQVLLIGGPDEHSRLADRLTEDLPVPVTVVDPFRAAGVPTALVPENPGRFAALLGMLQDESAGRPHAIDFLHPKRPPRPANRGRQTLIAVALVALTVLGVGYYVWSESAEIDETNQEYAQRLKDLNGLVKDASKQTQLIESVAQWKAEEVNWLDELRGLSERFPTSRDAILFQLAMTPGRGGGGHVRLSGLVRDPLVVTAIEQRLREDGHQDVRSSHILPREGDKSFPRSFEVSATVVPPAPAELSTQQASRR